MTNTSSVWRDMPKKLKTKTKKYQACLYMHAICNGKVLKRKLTYENIFMNDLLEYSCSYCDHIGIRFLARVKSANLLFSKFPVFNILYYFHLHKWIVFKILHCSVF